MTFYISEEFKANLYIKNNYYLKYAGDNPNLYAGWKIHISAVPDNAQKILSIVSDYLIPRNISFKFIKDNKLLRKTLSKSWERSNSGKFITIYPNSVKIFVEVVEYLSKKLHGFESPYILSDKNYKGTPVFYRYGRISDNGQIIYEEDRKLDKKALPYYICPEWVTDPFIKNQKTDEDEEESELFHGKYLIKKVLHMSNAGGTYLASIPSTSETVILKESRPHMLMIDDRFDAVYFRKKEKEILQELGNLGFENIPCVLDEFWEWEHYYIVVSYITGKRLIDSDIDDYRHVWIELTKFISSLHKLDVTLGDISPQNILINEHGVTSIDFELASSRKNVNLGLPYMKTPGFRVSAIDLFDNSRFYADCESIALLFMYLVFPTFDLLDQKGSDPQKVLNYIMNTKDDVFVDEVRGYLNIKVDSNLTIDNDIEAFYFQIKNDNFDIKKYKKGFFYGPIEMVIDALSNEKNSIEELKKVYDKVKVFSLDTGEIYDPNRGDLENNRAVIKLFLQKLINKNL